MSSKILFSIQLERKMHPFMGSFRVMAGGGGGITLPPTHTNTHINHENSQTLRMQYYNLLNKTEVEKGGGAKRNIVTQIFICVNQCSTALMHIFLFSFNYHQPNVVLQTVL